MYRDYFRINKNFQTSINLELDIDNLEKINEYIPTSDICDVIKTFLSGFIHEKANRATTLVGPYGKGKSFILLIISFLVSKNKNTKEYDVLLNKIRNIDCELYNIILDIRNKDLSLLPVLINCNYDDITQAFQIALNDSLKHYGLEEIIPESSYDICISLLDKWESDKNVNGILVDKCLETNKISVEKLRNGLKSFSPKAYKQFKDLYDCLNIGLSFNPLISNDIVKMYSDVNRELNKYGYSGMFIIFDEFGKFIESNSINLSHDLKIVQDLAERCSRTKSKEQLNLCCVAHKSLSLYSEKDRKDGGTNSFKTVEGRFSEIRFNRSMDENYQIISCAIQKDEGAVEVIDNYITHNSSFYEKLSNLSLFNNLDSRDFIFKGCFPLNPITTYCLIQMSEMVAQNERTLFTFLSDSDDNSFSSFIHNYCDSLFCLDKVYDYFYPLLQKEETNFIRNIWYRAESIISKLSDLNEKRIVKALAVILMINDFERLPANIEVLSLSVCLEESMVKSIIKNLIDKHLLRKNLLNNLLSFALSNSKHIDETIDYLSQTKFKNIRIGDYLDLISERKYILPRRYNEQNKITRFFSVIFLGEKEFMNITNFSYFFENKYCDGLIVNLLRETLSKKEIEDKVIEINDPKVVIRFPDKKIDKTFKESVCRYACLNEIRNEKNIDEVTIEELDLLIEETLSDIRLLVSDYFDNNSSISAIDYNGKPLNTFISDILDKLYTKKLIFNNELINKKTVSGQYQKAINKVIEYLLEGDDQISFSETSPEQTIIYSVLTKNENNTTFREVIDEIKESIINCSGAKKTVPSIVSKFRMPPYGIRDGVLPIILAKAISELSDDVILYFQSKEIELEPTNLSKSISNDRYSLSFSKSSNEQRRFVKNMMKLFFVNSTNSFRKDIVALSEAIKKFFSGLPQIVRLCSFDDNYLELDAAFIKYKTVFLSFNINPFESVLIEPKKAFSSNRYDYIYDQIRIWKETQGSMIDSYKNSIVILVKNMFGIEHTTSLKMGLSKWISEASSNKLIVVSEAAKSVINYFEHSETYNDLEYIDSIAYKMLNVYIEDWEGDLSSKLLSELSLMKRNVEESEEENFNSSNICNIKSEDNEELSVMGDLLKNNVMSIMDEFSDSVTPKEKMEILQSILKDLIK